MDLECQRQEIGFKKFTISTSKSEEKKQVSFMTNKVFIFIFFAVKIHAKCRALDDFFPDQFSFHSNKRELKFLNRFQSTLGG